MKLLTKSLAIAATLFLIACGDNGAAKADLTEGGDAPVDAEAVEAAKNDALAAEKANHEVRKEIFELQGKLGITPEEESE